MNPARVLIVYNRSALPGGEGAVVDDEIALLKSRGHEVETYCDSREPDGIQPFDAFARAARSRGIWKDVRALIDSFRPDVIHAHDTYERASSSVCRVAGRVGMPVVQTLHNLRLMCARARFLRNDEMCENCPESCGGVLRACRRRSHLGSAALAATLALHRALGTFRDKVTRYIALTEFCRRKFIEGGLPASRVTVKPNFAEVSHPGDEPRRGGLYVGRLSPEKGMGTLMAALDMLPGTVIDVIGDGPEAARVAAHPRLNLVGRLAHDEIHARMRSASYLVMPSIRYENLPRVLIEAFGNGLPIVASHRGSLLDLVDHGCTGLLFRPGSAEDLAQHIGWAETHAGAMRLMGANARREYEEEFTPDRNYERMMAIYHDAIAAAKPVTQSAPETRTAG